MKSTRSRRLAFISLALVFAVLVPGWVAAQSGIGQIVVFGTSLSDPGNAFVFIGVQNTPPYEFLDPLLVPDRPYAKGGHHFSNGATWVEQFSRPLGLAASTNAAFQGSSLKATNYAIGGTRAREGTGGATLGLQLQAFLQDFRGTAPSDALYVIEMGSNDVRDAFAVIASGGNGGPIIQAALEAISDAIVTLYQAGARRFLVWNVPDIGLTPALRSLGPEATGLGTSVAGGFNDKLDLALLQLSSLPGIDIAKLDVFKALQDINKDPSAFGLDVVDKACVMPNIPPFECKMPDEYLFWDGIHPTKAGHAILAQMAATALAQQ